MLNTVFSYRLFNVSKTMKLMSIFSTITIFCLGVSLTAATLPAQAQWATDTTEQPAAKPASNSTDADQIILLETAPTPLFTEDINTLNILAEQINQGMNGQSSDSFLPDGMVVRGSNSSLQVGSEL